MPVFTAAFSSSVRPIACPAHMANMSTAFVDSFNPENGEKDGAITFDEAVVHVNGLKLNGPLTKPLKSDRAVGDVNLGDLPLRDMFDTGGKVEQFADMNLNVSLDPTQTFWDNTIYRLCGIQNYHLPEVRTKCPLQHADHCHPIHHSPWWRWQVCQHREARLLTQKQIVV